MVQYVPSNLVTHPPENRVIDKVNEVARIHPVEPHMKQAAVREESGHSHPVDEKVRYGPLPLADRRIYCRRIYHWPVLEELRSLVDRRRHDPGGETGHVDEAV
ncbi:MAG: hypothetical protein ACYCZR_02315 [Burkholderiales bacterium]